MAVQVNSFDYRPFMERETAMKECERHTAALHAINETLANLIEREGRLAEEADRHLGVLEDLDLAAIREEIKMTTQCATMVAGWLKTYAARPTTPHATTIEGGRENGGN